MKFKYLFQLYTVCWVAAIIFLFYLLWNIEGDAALINYSGLVRGTTQKLVKEELYGTPDDELITYIDDILYDLQTGDGNYGLTPSNDIEFQEQLTEITILWNDIKATLILYHEDASYAEELFNLSEEHFIIADAFVDYLEIQSNEETRGFIFIFCLCIILYIGVCVIIYENYQKLMNRLISIDPQTNLLNRTGFEDNAAALVRQNPQFKYCIIKFDIDNFKLINTSYSYDYGDELLHLISLALFNKSNEHFIASHLDADNFFIVTQYNETILNDLKAFLLEATKDFDVSVLFTEIKFSYGAYMIEYNNESIKKIISKATMAHKAAKEDKFVSSLWYNQELLHRIQRENEYSTRIDLAISDQEFKMYLQPQVDLNTLKVISAESLVRWQLPDDSFIYPDQFIPIFERNGLIYKVDFYMLEQACLFLSKQHTSGNAYMKIAVNVSRVTLSRHDFLDTFVSIVDKNNVPHKYIEIEVTESSLNHLSEEIIDVLVQLNNLDFTLAMDDFGAGYSSLSSLSTFPVHFLKLDKQFLWSFDTNTKMPLIITSSVNLAHSMGMAVISEGVEQQSHVDFLISIGCEYAQGYHFARPMPSEEFENLYCSQILN